MSDHMYVYNSGYTSYSVKMVSRDSCNFENWRLLMKNEASLFTIFRDKFLPCNSVVFFSLLNYVTNKTNIDSTSILRIHNSVTKPSYQAVKSVCFISL